MIGPAIIGINHEGLLTADTVWRPGRSPQLAILFPAVIWRFPGDRNIMRMTFRGSGTGDLHKFCLFQSLNIFRATVAHSSAQATYQLVKDFGHEAFVRNTA